MSGHTSTNTPFLSHAQVYADDIKEIFEDKLMALRFATRLTDFPHGDTWNIPSIGQMSAQDYNEDDPVKYTNMDTGNFTFTITQYKQAGNYITKKALQDQYYADRLLAKFAPQQARAIAEHLEADILGLQGDQTAASPNLINGEPHRWVATGTGNTLQVDDFAQMNLSFNLADVPTAGRVAIVDPSVAFELETHPNIQNLLNNNPQWQEVLGGGISDGMTFRFNIYGWDIYVSDRLANVASETITSYGGAITSAKANIFMCALPECETLMYAMRQEPQLDTTYNQNRQRWEYVTTARWGQKLYRPEAFGVVLSKRTNKFS